MSPTVDGRIQAFPANSWESEFALANSLGYDCIELTIEMASYKIHPVRSKEGRQRLSDLCEENSISLAGLCCDIFMETPLTAQKGSGDYDAKKILLNLINDCAAAELPMIELPMMGDNSLCEDDKKNRFLEILMTALPVAKLEGVDILLETNLPPKLLCELMQQLNHERIGINYDAGNSTWFGFSPQDEISKYHRFIRNVHIKDCTQENYSVPLGKGETDLESVVKLLADHGYKGDFIIQGARQKNDLQAAADYQVFTRNLLMKHFPIDNEGAF